MKVLLSNAFLCCALLAVLFSSGCITSTENRDNGDAADFMKTVNGSQGYYDDQVSSDPTNATAWCIRAMYYNDYYNQYDKAMESCDKALELDPEYGLAWFVKGIILTNMNRTDEAALCFENATRYDPELKKELSFIVDGV